MKTIYLALALAVVAAAAITFTPYQSQAGGGTQQSAEQWGALVRALF